jgi:hypothetical protein
VGAVSTERTLKNAMDTRPFSLRAGLVEMGLGRDIQAQAGVGCGLWGMAWSRNLYLQFFPSCIPVGTGPPPSGSMARPSLRQLGSRGTKKCPTCLQGNLPRPVSIKSQWAGPLQMRSLKLGVGAAHTPPVSGCPHGTYGSLFLSPTWVSTGKGQTFQFKLDPESGGLPSLPDLSTHLVPWRRTQLSVRRCLSPPLALGQPGVGMLASPSHTPG